MSNVTILARPYAKAAFDLAEADGDTGNWNDMLVLTSTLVAEDTIQRLLQSPEVSQGQLVGMIAEAAGEALNRRFKGFLSILAENKRLTLLPEITDLYQRLREEADKLLRVRVVSAFELEEDQATRLKEALARRFEREILLDSEVDSSLIGGAVVYAGGQVIDGSLRDRLTKLSNSLTN
jgi:F-type H+-transporting ATPase subunit delta